MTLIFYPNFFRGKLPPNKIGLFLIIRNSQNIKIGEEIGEDGIVGRGRNRGQWFLYVLIRRLSRNRRNKINKPKKK